MYHEQGGVSVNSHSGDLRRWEENHEKDGKRMRAPKFTMSPYLPLLTLDSLGTNIQINIIRSGAEQSRAEPSLSAEAF